MTTYVVTPRRSGWWWIEAVECDIRTPILRYRTEAAALRKLRELQAFAEAIELRLAKAEMSRFRIMPV